MVLMLGRAQITSPVKMPVTPKTPGKSPSKDAPKTPTKTPSKAKANISPVKKTPVKTASTAKNSPAKKQSGIRTPAKSPSKASPTKKSKVNEVHIHVHPRTPPPPMNVTRVVHHSSKGEKEIVYRSPSKVGKDGRIAKGEKKVVHIHHHSREH
jgi:hypothetical protein